MTPICFGAIVALAAVSVASSASYPKFGDSIVYTNAVNLTSIFQLEWTIQTDTIYFQLTLTPSARTWLGVGWHPVGSPNDGMDDADIFISLFDDATGALINVTDAWAVTEDTPAWDYTINTCTDDVVPGSVSGSQDLNTNVTISRFARKLVTNDLNCDNPIQPGSLELIFAHGTSNMLGYHGYGNAGKINVTLATGL